MWLCLTAVRVWVSVWTYVSVTPGGCLVGQLQGHGVTMTVF